MAEARFLVFRVGPEFFLADVGSVRQVLSGAEITPVPSAPPFLEGIFVLDAAPVPVIDLRARLFPRAEPSEHPLILVVTTDFGILGLRVDDVRRTVNVDLNSILAPPAVISGLAGELVVGVTDIGDRVHLVLDLEKVLTTGEKRQLEVAVRAQGSPP
jgi:purine-binding chemotaxis protein CheW